MKEKYANQYKLIGEKILTLRKMKNWSQDDLANHCETVNRAKISKMENARVDYMFSTLLEVCDALEVNIAEVVGEK